MNSVSLRQHKKVVFALTVASHLVILSIIGSWLDDPLPFGNDNLNFRLPYHALVRRSFAEGDWPFWDLYSAGGMPLSSIFISSLFNPLVVFLVFVSITSSTALLLEVYIYTTFGVVGMWLWLRSCTWVYARAVLSLAWVNSLTIASALHLNFEVSASVVMMPWLMLGITGFQLNRAFRLAVLTVAVVAIATSGYLGLAPFILYGVMVYRAMDLAGKWLKGKQEVVVDAVSNWKLKLVEFVVVSVLVVGAMSIPLSETLVNLTAGVFLERSIDPFIGSLDWRSLSTIVSTGASETYGVFDDGGHLGSMFIPVVGIAGLSWGAVNGGSRYWSALVAGLVTFVISLSPSVPWSRWLVSVVPFLEDVRFHGFSLGIVLFFLTTAAAEGFRGGVPQGKRHAVAFLVLVSALTAFTFAVDRTLFDRVSVTLLVLIVGLLTYLVLGISSSGRAAAMVLVVLLTVVQIVVAPGSWTVPLIGEDRDLRRVSLAAIDREMSVEEMPVPQLRELKFENRELYGNMLNSHLVAGVPSLDTYSPHILPSMQAVIDEWKDERVERFRQFIFKPDYAPVAYEVLAFSADRASFRVPQESSDQWLTVTTPYSRGWSANSGDSDRLEIRPSRDQFLEVLVPAGKQTFTIEYKPLYLWLFAPLTALSWIVMTTLLVIGVYRHRKAKNVSRRALTS